MLKRSKMQSLLTILKIGTPPMSHPKVTGWTFLPVDIYIRNWSIPYININRQKSPSCYLRVWHGWGTYFQNCEERLHFWTFQHPNKKVWKYGLLNPKTFEVTYIWTGWIYFFQLFREKGCMSDELSEWTFKSARASIPRDSAEPYIPASSSLIAK